MNNTYLRAQQLRKKDAKFPFVKIGSQYWTLKNHDLSVTPQGTVIPEMQANGNVEKVVNGGFDTDSGWIMGVGVTISNGKATSSGTSAYGSIVSQNITMVVGKSYSILIDIEKISGITASLAIGGVTYLNAMTSGKYTATFIYSGAYNVLNLYEANNSTWIGSINNISVQEIGWSGSQELYDGIYSQTSGTVEQKTYAAVKAAAMWCNYNNDAPTGLIYGKLYNWFAVKLLQMDIDYYNAAHPTTPYGWRVPTQAEFQTLSTYLGGDAVSGGKLKAPYGDFNNAYSNNISGWSGLASYTRRTDGFFGNGLLHNYTWKIESGFMELFNDDYICHNNTINSDNRYGFVLRLIKA